MSAAVTPIAERVSKLPELTLAHGSHPSFTKGHCALEVVAWVAGEKHSDHPECVCPAIATFVRNWNDQLPDDATRTRVLGPLLLGMLNTRASATQGGDKLLVRRSYMAIDWEIRSRTPAFLRAIGLEEEAKALETLPEITNARELAAAEAVADRANNAASAAWSAAWSAARSAAESAAESAARSAAWSAAESAAGSAAESAAESAAWSAAESAAWSAARSAARSAAESAAGSAARSAAESAAESAAWSAARSAAKEEVETKLSPAVEACHASGADLVKRMCALTEDDVKDWSWE